VVPHQVVKEHGPALLSQEAISRQLAKLLIRLRDLCRDQHLKLLPFWRLPKSVQESELRGIQMHGA